MKRTLAIIMLMVLCLTMACVHAEEQVAFGDYEYELNEDGTITITKISTYDYGVLTVPETRDGYTVTAIGDHAVGGNCPNVSEFRLPDTVVSVGVKSFGDRFVYVSPNNPEFALIDGVLFSKTEKKLISYPSGLNNEVYEIPQGITTIGDYAFNDDPMAGRYFTEIIIPDSVTTIGSHAFSGCYGFTELNIPDSVTYIGDMAFSYCGDLVSVNIPDSVTYIGANPFVGSKKLEAIELSAEHPVFEMVDGVLFSRADAKLIAYPYYIDQETYAIPEGTKIIGSSAFTGARFDKVIIPESVSLIEKSGFYGAGMSGITVPGTNGTVIGAYAFAGCTNLKSATICDGAVSVGAYAFQNCKYIETVSIADSVTEVGEGAFFSCEYLHTANLPAGLTTLNNSVFGFCGRLEQIAIPEGVTELANGSTFMRCERLQSVVLPSSMEFIAEGAFEDSPKAVFTVEEGSYAHEYCETYGLKYTYPEDLSWLE